MWFVGQCNYFVCILVWVLHVQEGGHNRTTQTHTRRTMQRQSTPLLEASTTIPQQLLVFKEAVSSQVSGCVKCQYCKNHHCKIVKESLL